MRKSIVVALIFALLLGGIVLTPYGLPGVRSIKEAELLAEETRQTAQNNLNLKQQQVVAQVQEFNDGRTFGVFYGDITKVSEVMNSISGIRVASVTNVDPSQYYAENGFYKEGDEPAAVRFDLVVEDPTTALGVIESLQMPIVEISIEYPDAVSFIALTGGDI